jgi:hypothetical protein
MHGGFFLSEFHLFTVVVARWPKKRALSDKRPQNLFLAKYVIKYATLFRMVYAFRCFTSLTSKLRDRVLCCIHYVHVFTNP